MRNTLAIFLVLATMSAHAQTTRYISDELTVPMRSGTSMKHKILRFLNSGTSVVILREEGEYTQIRGPRGDEGWVLTKHLMATPSARVQLAKAGETVQALKKQRKELRAEIREQRAKIGEQNSANVQLQAENKKLSQSMEGLQKTAARPIQLEKENRILTQDLENERQRISRLEDENKTLRDQSIQQWFLIGGGVAIGSLILGLIITRIPWKRRNDGW